MIVNITLTEWFGQYHAVVFVDGSMRFRGDNHKLPVKAMEEAIVFAKTIKWPKRKTP